MAELWIDTTTDQFFVEQRVDPRQEVWLTTYEVTVRTIRMLTGNLVEGEKVGPRRRAEAPTTVAAADIHLHGFERWRAVANVHYTLIDSVTT